MSRLPKRAKSRGETKTKKEEIPIEERDLDRILSLVEKGDISKLTPWDKFKAVFHLTQEVLPSVAAEKLGLTTGTVRAMTRMSRERLQAKGINPDKVYSFIEQGESPWKILEYLDDPEFAKIVNESETREEFVIKFKNYRAIRTKNKTPEFKMNADDFLKMILRGDIDPIIKGRRPPRLNEEFIIRPGIVHGKLVLDENRRVVMTLWVEVEDGDADDDEVLYSEEVSIDES